MKSANDKKPVKRYELNWRKFIDLLIGVAFLTMALCLYINLSRSGPVIFMICLYSCIGAFFIGRRKFESRK